MTGKQLGPVLAGTRILITAQRRASDLALALERRGATSRIAPSIGVESHIDEEALLAQTRDIIEHGVDVVVLTTGIGFRAGWKPPRRPAGLGPGRRARIHPADRARPEGERRAAGGRPRAGLGGRVRDVRGDRRTAAGRGCRRAEDRRPAPWRRRRPPRGTAHRRRRDDAGPRRLPMGRAAGSTCRSRPPSSTRPPVPTTR